MRNSKRWTTLTWMIALLLLALPALAETEKDANNPSPSSPEAAKSDAAPAPAASPAAPATAAEPEANAETVPAPPEKKPFKGLYEALKEKPVRWFPDDLFKKAPDKSLDEWLITPPAKKKYVDPLFEPIFMLRLNYVTTQNDKYTDAMGKEHEVKDLLRTFYGYRESLILENVELGFKGRFNELGFYYGGKLELVPREKDGTKSENDFLKEAWVGWNYYSVVDVQIGRIKIPFSQANLKSTHDMTLIYSPILDSLLPKRLLGGQITLSDPWQIARLSGGVFSTAKEPYEQMESSDNLLYSARLEFRLNRVFEAAKLFSTEYFNLTLGGSYAYTKQNADTALSETRYIGFDGRLDAFIFTFEGELALKDYYGSGMESHLAKRGMGWHFDTVVHAWPKVLDLSFRIEEADNDRDLEVEFADDAGLAINQKKRWFTYGLMLHVARQLDVEFNYVDRREMEGKELDNNMAMVLLQFHI